MNNWLESNNFYKYSKEVPVPSHLLLDGKNGGKLYIPKNFEYTFLCKYAEEMKNGKKLYVVEQREKVFKFMIDLDICDNHYWENEEIIFLTKNIQSIIKDFFEGDHYTICCTSPKKIKNGKVHTGVHLIWNDLYVSSETALTIRTGIIQKLKKNEKMKLEKSWDDIIDQLVYTRVGYRMIGSDKMSKDKIPEERPLSLLFVMNSEGELRDIYYERLIKNFKELVLETSIRNVLDTYGDVGMRITYPKWLEGDFVNITRVFGSSHNYTILNTKEHTLIENFIRKNLPLEYKRCFIKSVSRYPDSNLLITTTSKYCMNIRREHNSCGIYFFASSEGMYQKCLCPCEKLEGRIKGYCKDYTSKCFKFDDEIRIALFPNSKKNKTICMFVPDTEINKKKEYEKVCNKLFANC